MSDQLFVGQLQSKVDELKTEFDLIKSLKDNQVNAKIQRSRDKICEILRRVQSKRAKMPTEPSNADNIFAEEPKQIIEQSRSLNEEVLRRRHYIFQFKMYLRRKREKKLREDEFKLFQQIDQNTQTLQKWVAKDNNDDEMYDFFYSQIDQKRKGQVHHLQIKNFMFENPLIMNIFQFDRDSLQTSLDQVPVKVRFHMNAQEFIGFLRKHQSFQAKPGFKQYIHLFDPTYQKVKLNDMSPRIMLLKNTANLKILFTQIENQGMVNLDQFIRNIRQSDLIDLFENAVHIVLLGLNLILESALQVIEIENLENTEYSISWNEFLYYFDNLPDNSEKNIEEEIEESKKEVDQESDDEDDYFYQIVKPPVEEEEKIESAKKVKIKNNRRKQHPEEINVEKKRITVPKKPKAEIRQQTHSPGIRERWLQEQVNKKQQEIEEAFRYKPFKANTIPYKVRDRNYYQELLDKDQIRRREIKERSKEITEQNQQPFSFYERDQNKKINPVEQINEEQLNYKFRANPVPWFCSLKLFERKILDQKLVSESRKKIRKFWLTQNSKMPPRMQEHAEREQDKLKERALSVDTLKKQQKPIIQAKPIPDFKKLHSEFEKELLNRKKQFKKTEPIAPTFHEGRKKSNRNYMDIENQQKIQGKIDPIQKAKIALRRKPKIDPKSTLKFENQVQLNQLIKWSELQNQERQEMEMQQREEKKQLFLPRVQQSWAIADHQQQQIERQQQQFIEAYQKRRQDEDEFNNMMKEIFVRVYQRPLLMEIESMKSQQMPMEQQDDQPYDYMNPIGEQEEEESEKQTTQDPEGVDQVGEQAEQSLPEDQEYYGQEYDGQEFDGQEIEDGQYRTHNDNNNDDDDDNDDDNQRQLQNQDFGDEEIDLDNIDPQLLKQMQREALAQQYGLSPEQLEQIENMDSDDEGDQGDDEEQEQDYYHKRHSF